MQEQEQLIRAYEHLDKLPRAADALHSLRKIASLVKPIMRNRGWHVGVLTEFYPSQANLLGLNVNRGQKICLRLRYPGDQQQFLPLEQVVDTMLHELSHIVHSPHNEQFHALWNTLRDEYQDLTLKGYTGEGFLSEGRRLGGRSIPIQEMRRQARAAAERRRVLTKNSGQRLGGAPVLNGIDMRRVIAEAASRRIERTKGITQGCASGTQEADGMADQASRNGFRTKAEEDDANDRAIAQALWELVQEDESRKAGVPDDGWRSEGLTWSPETGLQPAGGDVKALALPSKVSRSPYVKSQESSAASNVPPPVPYRSKPTPKFQEQQSVPPHQIQPSRNPLSRKRSFSASNTISPMPSPTPPPSTAPSTWSCPLCTLVNPSNYLCCDACGSERPSQPSLNPPSTTPTPTTTSTTIQTIPTATTTPPTVRPLQKLHHKPSNLLQPEETAKRSTMTSAKMGWNCRACGSFMENQWWTCSLCGRMKDVS